MYPKSLENLIESFKILPGVGQKTAERYALTLLERDLPEVKAFAEAIAEVKEKIHDCQRCHNLAEDDLCTVCQEKDRDTATICIVASAKEVYSIEKMSQYQGVYHVLGGVISTQRGVMPDDLNIETLLNRITAETQEIILAFNATVEGEMTALYLAKRLGDTVKTTRLAFGLPIGGQLDYADDMTLMKAFEGRKKM